MDDAARLAQEHGPVQDVINMIKSGVVNVPHALKGMLDSLKGHANPNPDIAANASDVAYTLLHPTETLTSVGHTLSAATPEQVGANVVAPLIAGGAVGKVEGEMGASRGVRRAEQGHPVTGFGRLEVGPVLRLPGHPQAQGLIESAGPLHVLDP
jgi:hypothetical protein